MIIRPETENDFAAIHDLVKTAFQTAKSGFSDEQDFVLKLRQDENYLPELALVLEDAGMIIGHIMLTKTYISRKDSKLEALLLAPVCVRLEYRNQGIGSDFIRHSLEMAKERGFKTVFLVGDPEFYQRFGFQATVEYGIKNTGNIPDKYVMALELEKGLLGNAGGTISIC
jgi:putative acetyltransferase